MSPLIRWILLFILVAGTVFSISQDTRVKDQIQILTDRLAGGISNITDKVGDLYPNRSCDEPLSYAIGELDGRFGISRDQVIEVLKEAEDVWENAESQNLFQYNENDPNAIKVNFIFDERQSTINEAKRSGNVLDNKWNNLENLISQHKNLSAAHQRRLTTYQADVKEYEELLAKFNKQVEEWNKGGGSKSQYEDLKTDENFVKTVFQGLEKEQIKINNNADQLNELANQIEKIQTELNRQTDIHNSNFGSRGTINSGEFDTEDINIYQYYTLPDLRLTLAHELGHSLGLDHVENEKSIMYYLLSKQDVVKIKPSVEDLVELRIVCQ